MIECFESPPDNFKPKVETSAVYVEYQGSYLFLETNSHKALADQWGVPAGKHEPDETPIAAAVRELDEEAGIQVQEEDLTSTGTLYFRKQDLDFIYHTYLIQFDKLPTVHLSDEHKNFKWVTMAEAKDLSLIAGADDALDFIHEKLIDPTKLIKQMTVQPKIYSTDLNFEKNLVDRDALQVIHRLKQAGFLAYLAGGAVRDMMLGRIPKDFDISTSAKPEEIKRIFGRQCILIGRRFRLAHVRFGHKILEVSTFRTGEMTGDLITQDNVWGTEQEDVMRRDFTINGLFYDPENHTVIDYVDGWEDLQKGVLHTIGDPEVRFKQDPVRMIRLLKFQARFHFSISDEVKKGLQICLGEINKSSPARVLEEMFRMMESCASSRFFELMLESGLMDRLFPTLSTALKGTQGKKILRYLEACDAINKQSTKFPIERPVLTSALIYPLLEESIANERRSLHLGDILGMTSNHIRDIILASFYHFPRRISGIMGYILSTQYRLTPLKSKKQHPSRLFRVREFPMALRLLKIRAMVNPELQKTYISWREHFRSFLRQEEMHTHRHRPPHERKSYEVMESKDDQAH